MHLSITFNNLTMTFMIFVLTCVCTPFYLKFLVRCRCSSCVVLKVELKEYVKMEDTVYSIQPTALCPDDRLQHSRILSFKVITSFFPFASVFLKE